MARENTSFSEIVGIFENTLVAEEGLEQIEELSETSKICAEGSAESGVLLAENVLLDPQLELLIQRWPTLSKAVQQQIMLLVG
jgi:hypothetical protein